MTSDPNLALFGQMAAELAAIKNELADVRTRYDMLHKRQILPLDADLLAIRHEIGWLIAPREDFATVVHLSDGVSGHEYGTLSVMRRFVREGDSVLDLGAHIGLHTIPLAQAVGPQGQVIAVEPLPRAAECLRRALICNGLFDRCDLVMAAAGNVNGTSDFYIGANSMLGSLYPMVDDQHLLEVRELRLDDYVGAETRVDFIKMDVEGAELRALAGMRGLLGRNPNIGLIAEYGPTHLEKVGLNTSDWFAAFAGAGLTASYVIDEASGALTAVDIERISDVYSANILFVCDSRRVEELGVMPASGANKKRRRK
jgi:FkbM family methyltransferase